MPTSTKPPQLTQEILIQSCFVGHRSYFMQIHVYIWVRPTKLSSRSDNTVYIYTYIYIYIFVDTVDMFVLGTAYMNSIYSIYIYAHTYITLHYIRLDYTTLHYTTLHTYIHPGRQTDRHTYMHAYIHTYIHTHTYTYIISTNHLICFDMISYDKI